MREKTSCTGCNICDPCGYGVRIPENLKLYDDFFFGDEAAKEEAKKQYLAFQKENEHGGNCARCHLCEKICPVKINIIALLDELDEVILS